MISVWTDFRCGKDVKRSVQNIREGRTNRVASPGADGERNNAKADSNIQPTQGTGSDITSTPSQEGYWPENWCGTDVKRSLQILREGKWNRAVVNPPANGTPSTAQADGNTQPMQDKLSNAAPTSSETDGVPKNWCGTRPYRTSINEDDRDSESSADEHPSPTQTASEPHKTHDARLVTTSASSDKELRYPKECHIPGRGPCGSSPCDVNVDEIVMG